MINQILFFNSLLNLLKKENLHQVSDSDFKKTMGGGIGMGKTCEPKAFSFQCMTKFTTNKKNK